MTERFGNQSLLTLLAAVVALLAGPATDSAADEKDKEPTREQIEFFEKKIRPVLVDKCYSCHSHKAKSLKGDYHLDSRDAMRKGGESGKAALVPGKPDDSPLIKMIRRTDEDEAMPPKEKDALSKQQVKDFEEWVKMGAPDPRKEPPKDEKDKEKKSADAGGEGTTTHWAFAKPVEPAVPSPANAVWVKNPVDAFVLAKLESKGMRPAPPADKRTLIRRAYFTLVGLPPAPEEVEAFVADESPDAFAKVVERLLASPRYGERWARYWLDVARYADTKGYVFEQERKFPSAYTYRDYVIRAFNEDLPYDQFLIQQIAADRLDLKGDNRPLAAMGFLTVGRRFLENPHDIIDDRIDVVTRGTMGLTVQCARCHDHKYDPIPIDDYYSLYGIFASSVEPQQLPLIGPTSDPANAASAAFEQELKTREAAVEAFLAEKSGEALKGLRTPGRIADYMMTAQDVGSPAETAEVNRRQVQRWAEFLAPSKAGHDPIFTPWQAYAAVPPAEFAAKAAAVTEQLFATSDPARPIHPLVADAFRGKPPASLRETAERYGQLFSSHSQEQPFEDTSKESLRMVLHGLGSPLYAVGDQRARFLKRDQRQQYTALRRKVDELKANDPGAPPAAMVLNDSPNPSDARVFKRGNAGMPGDVVPRRFLACASPPGAERKPFADGSGRLELARAIASPENPLTARVMVNRIWLNHFGAGLVRTPSDFGVRCDPPAHPQLLDWLALRFIEGGWSVKNVHRLILLSSTWQQSSDGADASYATTDPENTLLWRQNRRRMDFEAMRDSLLAVAEQLDETSGGRPVDATDPANNRRSVYGFIDRQNLPNIFRTFDFASPDQHSPNRFFTTVPQQALFMLNSPFIERVSREAAARDDFAAEADLARKIDRLHRTLYARPASAEEQSAGVAFINEEQGQPAVVDAAPWRYGFGRYDAASDRVVEFTAFARFAEDRWQAREAQVTSDASLKWAGVSAAGGHPGGNVNRSVIRRWTAPADGTLSLGGTIGHKDEKSDGVLARVVSSRLGQLASWTVRRMEAATSLAGVHVKKGDVIDFVVEPRATSDFDGFAWSPTIRLSAANAQVAGAEGVREFDARRDFSGAPAPASLSAWEKYAQVLLLSNEFAFVD